MGGGTRWLPLLAGLATVAAGCRLPDLLTTSQSAPSVPAGLQQAQSYGDTAIVAGGAAHDSAVVLSATVVDPDARDSLTLQVEVRLLGSAFSDSVMATSLFVANGAVAAVAVSGLAEAGAYRWQARVADPGGRTSAWVAFGTDPTTADFLVDASPDPPAVPGSLTQLKTDGVTVIPVGGTTGETSLIFQAVLADPDAGDSVRLEVEREPLGTTFTNVPTATSPVVPAGGTARATVSGELDNLSYHWQARAVDRTGLTSAWVSFGGNAEVQADYRVSVPAPPDAPGGLGQFLQNGQTAIAVGGTTTQSTVVFKATVADANGDQVRLEVEVQPVGTDFTGTATGTGSLVASGATARVDLSALAAATDYHWQGRAVDQTGRAGPWVSFGDNPETAADFRRQ